jgi:hypothetical protein
MKAARSSSLKLGWPLSSSGSALFGALNRLTNSQGFASKIGAVSPGRISRHAQENMPLITPNHTLAM